MNFRIKLLCLLGLPLLTTLSIAQTQTQKFGISIGGGPQDYKSKVGNGFKLKSENSWHGAAIVQAATFLNQSLDLVFFGSIGDLGAGRLKSFGLALKFKFANGRLMEETSKLRPYAYAGAAYNNHTEIKNGKVNGGDFMSLNGGLGARYYIRERIHIGYNLAIGSSVKERTDVAANGDKDEIYFHNALMLGVDL